MRGPGAGFRAPAADHQVGLAVCDRIGYLRELRRIERTVAIHEGDDLGLSSQETCPAGCPESRLRLPHDVRTETSCHATGIIGGAVVDDQWVEPLWQTNENSRNCVRFVEHREADVGPDCNLPMEADLEPEKSLQGCLLYRVWPPFRPRVRTLRTMSVRLENPRDELKVELAHGGLTRRHATALLVWFALIAGVAIGGRIVNESFATNVLAPPLFGRFDVRVGPSTLLAVAVSCLVVWFGPRVAANIPWRMLLVVTTVAAGTWALSLAMVDGIDALSSPLSGPHDYLVTVDRIDSPGIFLESFVDRLETFSLHVQGQPPGMVLIFWGLAQVGLGGSAWATVLVIGTGVSASAATLFLVKAMAGESSARNLAPFLAISPAAIWIATSVDAFFMGVGAWGIAMLALGAQRKSDLLSLMGGVILGLTLFLSYGAVALAPIALVVACLLYT